MPRKVIKEKDKRFACPSCGYEWTDSYELDFDEMECVPCCPVCKELIEDGDDGSEYYV